MMRVIKILLLNSLVLVAACGPMGKLEGQYSTSELTGGSDAKTHRPYTRTSDGSDKSLEYIKSQSNPESQQNRGAASQISDIKLDKSALESSITVDTNDKTGPVQFSGNLPSTPGTKENWRAKSSSNSLLTMSCTDACNSYVGVLQSPGKSVGFILRDSDAKAKILFLQPSEAFKIKSTFETRFPALVSFISDFHNSQTIKTQSYEVALGKSSIRLNFSWDNGTSLCLQTPSTTTDINQNDLTKVKVTCGENLLPNTDIYLVGNNQSGKIALRFILDNSFAFLLFIDLNNKDLPDNQKITDPLLLLPDVKDTGRSLFKSDLSKPRTLLTMKQFYRDFPDNAVDELPEQAYGKKIIKNWIEKWQGSKADVSTCFDNRPVDQQFKENMSRFIKFAPKRFTTVVNIFKNDDVPSAFIFTTLAESPQFYNKQPKIEVSEAGAVGPWQLMEETAKSFGLITYPTINNVVDPRDDRANFLKATHAAVSYFKRLLGHFGDSDYKLALAAYNQGEKGLFNYIRNTVTVERYDRFYTEKFANRSGPGKPENYKERIEKNNLSKPLPSDQWQDLAKKWAYKIPSYWFLHEFHMMPCETRNYVPKLVSAMMIGENPANYGF